MWPGLLLLKFFDWPQRRLIRYHGCLDDMEFSDFQAVPPKPSISLILLNDHGQRPNAVGLSSIVFVDGEGGILPSMMWRSLSGRPAALARKRSSGATLAGNASTQFLPDFQL
jgi:hypothetical protein